MWTLLLAFFFVLSVVGCGGAGVQSAGTDDASEGAVVAEGSAETSPAGGSASESDVELAQDEAGERTRSLPKSTSADRTVLPESGTYTSKDEVAWYLHTYGHLPSNFVTKREAERAGWKTEDKTLGEACPGKSIGGDRFGNYEKLLPTKRGRTWYECDIDYRGGKTRGSKRIVYSSDGLIYYTQDHYRSFERIY
jgi:guanyl-specific ribonuclease Sa